MAQADDFVGKFNLPMHERGQLGDTAALLRIVDRQRRDRRQRCGCLLETVSIGGEKSVVAHEYETAIADLDVLHRRTKVGETLDNFVRVPDPVSADCRRDDASIGHCAQREQHEDRDAESELQPSNEGNAQSVTVIPNMESLIG